jgi:hypothetical protein
MFVSLRDTLIPTAPVDTDHVCKNELQIAYKTQSRIFVLPPVANSPTILNVLLFLDRQGWLTARLLASVSTGVASPGSPAAIVTPLALPTLTFIVIITAILIAPPVYCVVRVVSPTSGKPVVSAARLAVLGMIVPKLIPVTAEITGVCGCVFVSVCVTGALAIPVLCTGHTVTTRVHHIHRHTASIHR